MQQMTANIATNLCMTSGHSCDIPRLQGKRSRHVEVSVKNTRQKHPVKKITKKKQTFK